MSDLSSFFSNALNTPAAYQAPQFNQANYNVPSYAGFTQAGQQGIANNLAQGNDQTAASQQAQGGLNSGSTGLGYQNNLNNAANQNANLANQVGQMQYQNAMGQYGQQVQAGENQYNNAMQNHLGALSGLSNIGGSLLGGALKLL